jgi:hypothetical protein
MSDIEKLNAFLKKEDLGVTEKAIKDQVVELDAAIKANSQEREKLTTSLKEKEVEFLRLSGAFDAQLKLILSLSKSDQVFANVLSEEK